MAKALPQESYDFRKIGHEDKVKLAEERNEEKPPEPQKTIDEMTRKEKAEFLGDQSVSLADRPRAVTGGYKHARAVTETPTGLTLESERLNVADDAGWLPSQGLDLAKQGETRDKEGKEPGEPSNEVKAAQERAKVAEGRDDTFSDKLAEEAQGMGEVNSGVMGKTSFAEEQKEEEPAKDKKGIVQKAKEALTGTDEDKRKAAQEKQEAKKKEIIS